MPYMITTQAPDRTVWEGPRSTIVTRPPVTRTAVATLDEARETVRRLAWSNLPDNAPTPDDAMAIHDIPAEGGTVGPLPDGTVIEVRWTDDEPNEDRDANALREASDNSIIREAHRRGLTITVSNAPSPWSHGVPGKVQADPS